MQMPMQLYEPTCLEIASVASPLCIQTIAYHVAFFIVGLVDVDRRPKDCVFFFYE